MPRLRCKMCDVDFIAFRKDAITCGPRCRKAYERKCRKITQAATERFEQLCEESSTPNVDKRP
jgi:hypothetical protein